MKFVIFVPNQKTNDMKKAITFAVAVCLFSWALFGVFYALCQGDVKSHAGLFTAFESVYMFFPMIVAMILQKIRKEPFRSTGLLNFKISWAWLAASLMPLAAVLICIPISALFPGVSLNYGADQVISEFGLDETTSAALQAQFSDISPWIMVGAQAVSGIVAGCTINALFAFGEEYGWRNYLVDALKNFSFWKKAVFIGLVWGIWHAPLILQGHNYPQHPVIGVALMCVFCVLLGIIELYFVMKTHSVFPAAIVHGTINALSGFVLFFVKGGNDLTVGMTGAAGFVSLVIICAAIWTYDRYVSKERIMAQ